MLCPQHAPNGASRILDEANRIMQIANYCAKIGFNSGPTLLSCLEVNAPLVPPAALDADRESQKTFSGHSSALAQTYNHMILPLAYQRDKDMQVPWEVRNFEHRFGRPRKGMWLPETAMELETLEILAELGLRFTSWWRIRSVGCNPWRGILA